MHSTYSYFLQLFSRIDHTVTFFVTRQIPYSTDSEMEARSEMTQNLFYPLHVHPTQFFIISLSVA
jgi:hypothetical protein